MKKATSAEARFAKQKLEELLAEEESRLFDAKNRVAFALAQKAWRSAVKRGWASMSLAQLAEAATACRQACLPDQEDFPEGGATVRDKPDAIAGLALRAKELGGRLDKMDVGGGLSLATLIREVWEELPSREAKRLSPKLLEWEEWGPALIIEKRIAQLKGLCPVSAKMPKGAARALATFVELRIRREIFYSRRDGGVKEVLQFCELNPSGAGASAEALAAIAEAARSGEIVIQASKTYSHRRLGRQETLECWRAEMGALREMATVGGVQPSEFVKEITELGLDEIKRNLQEASWVDGCLSAIKNDSRELFAVLLDAGEAMRIGDAKVIYNNERFVCSSSAEQPLVSLLDCAARHGSLECAKELIERGRFGVDVPPALEGGLPRLATVLSTLKERALDGAGNPAEAETWEDLLCQVGAGLGKVAIAQGHDPEASSAWAAARIGANPNRSPKGKSAYERLAISYAIKVRNELLPQTSEACQPGEKAALKTRRL